MSGIRMIVFSEVEMSANVENYEKWLTKLAIAVNPQLIRLRQ